MTHNRKTLAINAALLTLCSYTATLSQASTAQNFSHATDYSKTHPVLLVHGWEMWHVAKTDCATKFKPLINELKDQGFTGPFVTVTYYKKSTNCDVNLTDIDSILDKDSSWKDIGQVFSNYVFDTYSQYGQPVDLLGHSMGGLVVRSAVQGGDNIGATGFDKILVEDAVTIATPHKGSGITGFCIHAQCKTLSPDNPDYKWLASTPYPNGLSRVDWSIQGSKLDALVSADSSMSLGAKPSHRKLFSGLSHNYQLVNKKSIAHAATSLATDKQ